MAKNLQEGFDAFLGLLKPLSSEEDKARSHKDSVKSCLVNNFECTKFFETGSFGNGTGIRHYSDTDYFAVIPNKNLWNDSANTLRKIKEAFQQTFKNTFGIEVKCPAVKIPFGNLASETLEITPCTFRGLLETPLGKFGAYEIADGYGGWMNSSPEAHNKYVRQHDERLDSKLKSLIRFIKAWKYYNNVPISSFYLELRITEYAEPKPGIVYDLSIKSIINKLLTIELADIQDPMGISGYIEACSTDAKQNEAMSKLATALGRAEKAIDYKEKNLDKSFEYWDLFFNDKFPAR